MPVETIERDRDGLRAALAQVDVEGWDGEVGRAVLVELRHTVVLPLVARIGLRGLAAEQAAATGWAAGWEVLRAPSTRAAVSPWGVVWVAVRRAILNERMTAVYATTPREAWRQETAIGDRRLVSIESLISVGREPACGALGGADQRELPRLVVVLVDLMVEVGWSSEHAREVVHAVGEGAPWTSDTGWRRIARDVDAEPWQVRRLIAVLRHPAVAALRDDLMGTASRDRVRTLLRCTLKRRPTERLSDLGLADRLAS